MRIRATVTVVMLAVLAAPVFAQEQVTIVKRDGGRVSGRFEAWARNTNLVYVRVSQNDQPRIPLNDILVMEVGGSAQNLPANELDAARGGDHVLVLTSGEILRGRLVNIEGGEGSDSPNEPRVVSFKPANGNERRVRMSEVRRFYSGNYPAAAEPAPAPAPPPGEPPAGSIQVPANMRWTSTGLVLGRGDQIQVQASGEVQLSADGGDKAAPAGSTRGRYATTAPVPGALAGALIGRVGNGAPFPIGDRGTPFVPAGVGGELVLGINDDELSDNQGAFTVVVRQLRRR